MEKLCGRLPFFLQTYLYVIWGISVCSVHQLCTLLVQTVGDALDDRTAGAVLAFGAHAHVDSVGVQSLHPLELFVHALVPDAVSLLVAAVAAEEGLQQQFLFPIPCKSSGALVEGF